jgi:hypothetical protein
VCSLLVGSFIAIALAEGGFHLPFYQRSSWHFQPKQFLAASHGNTDGNLRGIARGRLCHQSQLSKSAGVKLNIFSLGFNFPAGAGNIAVN